MGGGASALFGKYSKVMNSMGETIGMNGKYQPSGKKDRCKYPNPTNAHFDEALVIIQEQFLPLNLEFAALYPDDQAKQNFFITEYYHVMGHLIVNSHADNFEPKIPPRSLRTAIKQYNPSRDAAVWAKTAGKQNWIHSGLFTYQLALQWGDVESLNTWHAKHLAGLEAYNLATGRNFKQTGTLMAEVGDILFTPLHVLVLLGKEVRCC